MTALEAIGPREESGQQPSTFGPCPRCSMVVRKSEMAIHLAHAHNIGPAPEKKGKRNNDRGRRDRS